MAFNFNWSPLTADAGFYKRARDLLTTALNKSPKPPIIVDDIIVTEFNLGSVPPDLEILEIGDLAEDRFRGIFKMCYSGDAFLTLKTRVQVGHIFRLLPYRQHIRRISRPSFFVKGRTALALVWNTPDKSRTMASCGELGCSKLQKAAAPRHRPSHDGNGGDKCHTPLHGFQNRLPASCGEADGSCPLAPFPPRLLEAWKFGSLQNYAMLGALMHKLSPTPGQGFTVAPALTQR
jgi:hypothetical protein